MLSQQQIEKFIADFNESENAEVRKVKNSKKRKQIHNSDKRSSLDTLQNWISEDQQNSSVDHISVSLSHCLSSSQKPLSSLFVLENFCRSVSPMVCGSFWTTYLNRIGILPRLMMMLKCTVVSMEQGQQIMLSLREKEL